MIPAELLNAVRDGWAWAGLHPYFFWGWILCLAVNNGLRLGAYRDYVNRPGWVRFVIAATDPACLNFWRLLSWVSAKFSLPFKFPGDDTQTVPSASIAAATKDQKP